MIPDQRDPDGKGVDHAGSLAPETSSPGVLSRHRAGSGEVDNAKRLIAFFASARAAEAIKKSGMEPVASARRRGRDGSASRFWRRVASRRKPPPGACG